MDIKLKLQYFPLFLLLLWSGSGVAQDNTLMKSIKDFGVSPQNSAEENKIHLQEAIDWAAPRGAALFVEPSAEPYPVGGGIILKQNASLIGVQGPLGSTCDTSKKHPVGSVFQIEDEKNVFISVESSTQIRGIQFWYPKQTTSDPSKIIKYPPTIQLSHVHGASGVTLSSLTFYGEYVAMDLNGGKTFHCALLTIENCHGYPLSGEFVKISYCYDIPRILHCHVNPAMMGPIGRRFSKEVIDAVVAQKTFAYTIDKTDNAVVIDIFTFGTYGGIYLGNDTYGQLTNFNFGNL